MDLKLLILYLLVLLIILLHIGFDVFDIHVNTIIESIDAKFFERVFSYKKGCLVHRQKEGLDYFDTYSPITRKTSIRVLIVIVTLNNMDIYIYIYQMDVKTAKWKIR